MRIAVAGGTGVVGTYVVEAARAAGHHVVALSRRTGVDIVPFTPIPGDAYGLADGGILLMQAEQEAENVNRTFLEKRLEIGRLRDRRFIGGIEHQEGARPPVSFRQVDCPHRRPIFSVRVEPHLMIGPDVNQI